MSLGDPKLGGGDLRRFAATDSGGVMVPARLRRRRGGRGGRGGRGWTGLRLSPRATVNRSWRTRITAASAMIIMMQSAVAAAGPGTDSGVIKT